MKELKFFSILFFFPCLVFCQAVKATYSLQIDMSGEMSSPFYHTYELLNVNGVSVQSKFWAQSLPQHVVRKDKKRGMIVGAKTDTSYVFKDFINNEMYSPERLFTNDFDVKDKLSVFQWEILSDTATILTFKCRKAKTSFRGRLYEVFYTEEIPVPDGPAKFNGLPGLILHVRMMDSKSIYLIECTKVAMLRGSDTPINPFLNKKTITFDEFKRIYRRKYSEVEAYSQTTEGFKVHRGGVEVLE